MATSFLDMFMPNASNYLTPDQQSDAFNYGLMNAGLGLIDSSSNQYGLAKSPFQIAASGLRGFATGANDYTSNLNNVAAAQQNNSAAIIKNLQAAYAMDPSQFDPMGGKGSAMTTAMTQPGQAGAPVQPVGTPGTPARPAGSVSGGASTPPNSLSSYYSQPAANGPGSTGANTAFGVDQTTLARNLFNKAQIMSRLQLPGADELMKKAFDLDPSIIYTSEYAKTQGGLPAELTKIGATGNETRKTETHKAGITPNTQPLMIGGQMVNVPTNNLALATGKLPNLASYYGNNTISTPSGQVSVSSAVPESAKTQSNELGKSMADAQNASSLLDSRMTNALDMIRQMKEISGQTRSGYSGQLGNMLSRESGGGPHNEAQTKFEQLNSNLFTQELPGIIKGAGGRLDIPLLNAIQQASAIDPYAPPSTKKSALDSLEKILIQAQQNAANNVTNLSAQTGINSPKNPVGQLNTPEEIGTAFKSGLISRETAKQLLQQKHGMQ